MKILIAATGASGIPLTIGLLKALQQASVERHLVVSQSCLKVIHYETDLEPEALEKMCEFYYAGDQIQSSICSGSFPMDGMVVVPCSMNTLAKIAHGLEDNAISRSVAVNLKQERKVILLPRETPLSLPQLKNMVKAKEAGCSIVPPMLVYYTGATTLSELTNFFIGRVLELLGIDHELYPRWNQENS